jgi:hypothetical protein
MRTHLHMLLPTVLILIGLVVTPTVRSEADEMHIQLMQSEDMLQLLDSTNDGFRVSYRFSRIDWFDVETERGSFAHVSIPGLSHSTRLGHPKLPVGRRIISVPLGASVSAEAIDYSMEEVVLSDYGVTFPVMPAQPPHPKNVPAGAVPFAYEPAAYAVAGYGDQPLVHVEELGILRGLRLFLLVVEPVRYDPSAQRLVVHNNIEVEVTFTGGSVRATEELRRSKWSPYFESVYSRTVLNYRPTDGKDDLTRYPVKYVIVSDSMFAAQLQPFIEWKTQKGFEVITGYVGDPGVGSTNASIKSYIQGLYDAGTPQDPAPSFVLLVGDVGQVPAWNGTTGQHVTDLPYVKLAGADYMPEMYCGRFSANTPSELQPQIDKTLEYERYEMPDPAFLGEAVMIAGVDHNYAQTWANGQINYGTTYYFNAAHGIVSHTYLYPASGSHAADIISDVSNGVGYANYTAHGYEQGWGDPAFTVYDIQGLANAHRYPTAVGNCCLTNSFNYPTCFGEAWLRAENKGAIGYIGATNSSTWDEDFWWGVGAGTVVENPTYEATGPGAYDGMFHDHGEPFPQWYTSQYGFIMAGCLAVVEAGAYLSNYYWEIYALMGDPSLSTFFGIPAVNPVSCPTEIAIGDTSFTLTADPWSYAGLSRDGQLYAATLVDLSGQATLEFGPFPSPGEAHLVITRQSREPVLASIMVVPGEGPYVVTAAVAIDDTTAGNGNGQADFAETLRIALTEENIGTETAYGVDVTISTPDPYVVITDSVEHYGDIAAGQQITIPGGFEAVVSPNVPDNHTITVDVTATDNAAHEWNDSFAITAYAPVVSIESVVVSDTAGNGDAALDPGETATLDVDLGNSGGASVASVQAILSTADPYITVDSDTQTFGAIGPGETVTASYGVTVDAAAPPGHWVAFSLGITGDNYAVTDTFSLPVGLFVEDFETGDFSAYPWAMSGDAPWTIASTGAYEGAYCAVSGSISDDQTSDLQVTLQAISDGDITFHYRVSSETNYDFLRFYVDGVQRQEWSGELDWSQASFSVAQGSHTFLWRYEKDGSVSNGSDCAWIDYITFPALGEPVYPDIEVSPASFEVSVPSGQTATELLAVANTGEADLTYTVSVTTQARSPAAHATLKLAKGEPDPRRSDITLKGSGGPDGFGYTWVDSDEPDGPSYSWIDISTMGTSPGGADDANYGPIDIGFPFVFYGSSYTAVQICTNGWLSFTSTSDEWSNQEIPNADDPNALIAPFWDDLNPSSGGTVYYHSDQANGRFIVQWDQVPHYYAPPDTGVYTFQVILQADGRILYQYRTLQGNLAACTVGIENVEGTDGLQVAFNQPYLHDALAILFEAEQPWLTVTPLYGTVEPDSTDHLAVALNAADLGEGTYQGTVTLSCNDPDEPSVAVPVTMHVQGAGAQEGSSSPVRLALDVSPNPFSSTCRLAGNILGALPDDVAVFDIKGNLVWRYRQTQPVSGSAVVWRPAPSVGNGMYVVRATMGKQVATERVVFIR